MNESEERKAFEARYGVLSKRQEASVTAVRDYATLWDGWIARASIAAKQSAEPVAWQYELWIEGQRCNHRVFDDQQGYPFGVKGRDYSDEASVIERPLYATPPSPTAVEAPSLREALAELVAAINQIGDPLCGGQNRYLDAISRARAALASPTAGEARDAPDREALAKLMAEAWNEYDEQPPEKDWSDWLDEAWLYVADAAIAALTGDSKP